MISVKKTASLNPLILAKLEAFLIKILSNLTQCANVRFNNSITYMMGKNYRLYSC